MKLTAITKPIDTVLSILLFISVIGSAWSQEPDKPMKTEQAVIPERYGVQGIEMKNRMPTPESSKKLFDAMDYYGAVQTYLSSLPAMGLKGWENANIDMGASPDLDGQICLYTGYEGAGGILTPNTAVTYVISFINTETQGPAVWIIPPGKTAGYVGDYWQRPVLDVGVGGKEKGKGIKLLIVGPDQEVPEHDGSYTVVRCPTSP